MAVFASDAESQKQYNRLRRDTGAPDSVLDDAAAEEYFSEASERYPDDTAKMVAYARVLVLRGILASASLLGKYAQNQSQEDLTKVFDNLTKLVDYWSKEVGVVSDPLDTSAIAPFFFDVGHGQRGR